MSTQPTRANVLRESLCTYLNADWFGSLLVVLCLTLPVCFACWKETPYSPDQSQKSSFSLSHSITFVSTKWSTFSLDHPADWRLPLHTYVCWTTVTLMFIEGGCWWRDKGKHGEFFYGLVYFLIININMNYLYFFYYYKCFAAGWKTDFACR